MARLLIVEARFYDHLNDLLLEGTRSALKGHEVEVMTVPGALEVPAAIARASETGRYDGYVALGVVIRGETYHFEIVRWEEQTYELQSLMRNSYTAFCFNNKISDYNKLHT